MKKATDFINERAIELFTGKQLLDSKPAELISDYNLFTRHLTITYEDGTIEDVRVTFETDSSGVRVLKMEDYPNEARSRTTANPILQPLPKFVSEDYFEPKPVVETKTVEPPTPSFHI